MRGFFSHDPARHGAGRHGLAALLAMAQQHGRGHGGRGGGGRHGDGFGDDEGLTRGRKFSADDLQLLLLGLLADGPSHGYELIKALQTRSNGYYTPSPGVVYPALTYLEEIGLASVEMVGNKKSYQLTEAGQAHLDANRERLALMLAKLQHLARKLDWMRRAMAGEQAAQPGDWLAEFVAARQALKQALLLRDGADHAEQRRIAAILRRATAEIETPAPTEPSL